MGSTRTEAEFINLTVYRVTKMCQPLRCSNRYRALR